jgi:hypothetical protein
MHREYFLTFSTQTALTIAVVSGMKFPMEPTTRQLDVITGHHRAGDSDRRYLERSISDLGPLQTRYDISKPIMSWGSNVFEDDPEILVHEPGGSKRPPNDGDFQKRPITGSDTGDSEGASSVYSVHDLGFGAAPAKVHPQFEDNIPNLKQKGSLEIESCFSLHQLCQHLHWSGDSPSTVEALIRNKIEESLERSQPGNQEYLPIDAFEDIFDIEAIKSLIKETYPEKASSKWSEIVAHIVGSETIPSYRRILGTLVLMKRVDYISAFINKDIGDPELPFKRSHNGIRNIITRSRGINQTLFADWDRNDIELFYVYQKILFIPYFDIREGKLSSYVLDFDIRLPWRSYQTKTRGGNGLVHQIQIHPSHHNFKRSINKSDESDGFMETTSDKDCEKPLYFALKEIFAPDRNAYRRELQALEKSTAQTQRENHLIKLLLTFQHGETCYLLFEWADGNLGELWEQPHLSPAPSDTWAAQQCLGIACAIKRIHGLATWQKENRKCFLGTRSDDDREYGRHGDIKPNNILWFSMYGNKHHHLVVSDLGLTRYHSLATKSAVPLSHVDGLTRAYRPPEWDLTRVVSPKYDIWSLGCVFFEFCVWYVEGIKGIHYLEDQREQQDISDINGYTEDKYFNIRTGSKDEREAIVKPIVEEVCARLKSDSNPILTQQFHMTVFWLH